MTNQTKKIVITMITGKNVVSYSTLALMVVALILQLYVMVRWTVLMAQTKSTVVVVVAVKSEPTMRHQL
jgi:hypothetical protein